MSTRSRQRGVAAVELALVTIPLLLFTFGITEFGRAMYQYNSVVKGVRDGVRYLTHYSPGDTARIQMAKYLVVCGTTTPCPEGASLVPGMNVSMISTCDRTNCADHNLQAVTYAGATLGPVNLVTLTVTGFQFISLVPTVIPNITFGPISSTMEQVL